MSSSEIGGEAGNGPDPLSTANSKASATKLEGKVVATRSGEYLVSVRAGSVINPQARVSSVLDVLKAMPDVEVLHTIKPSGSSLLSTDGSGGVDIHVIRTTEERAAALQASAANTPDVVIEANHKLSHLGDLVPQLLVNPTNILAAQIVSKNVQIQVTDEQGNPIPRATVNLWGSGFPVQGVTDAQGLVTLKFAGDLSTAQALYVKPFADFWERWIWNPALVDQQPNDVKLRSLSTFAGADFPGSPFFGWGQRAMGLDEKSAGKLTGEGVRVAIVDSGCDSTHPALTQVRIGFDYTNLDAAGNPNPQTWSTDAVSHGTHCAGVIAGNGNNGIRGFAPKAEVHVLKLFEGGAFDSLIRSLKYAIDNQIDVMNCSLGSDQSSDLVAQWMEKARQAGIAVVVAAGNSSGPVQFPGSLNGVLTVSAVGQNAAFPDDTYHAQTVVPQKIGVNGFFSPKFTCFGPEVKVCGPGVAIISSVPGGGYAAWDGTSMAAPHLTGLAALVLAHHPAFKNAPRSAARVDLLFQTIVAAAKTVGMAPTYQGAGLPSTQAAQQASMPAANSAVLPDGASDQLAELIKNAVIAAVQASVNLGQARHL
jgi:subtilisin family serine protease